MVIPEAAQAPAKTLTSPDSVIELLVGAPDFVANLDCRFVFDCGAESAGATTTTTTNEQAMQNKPLLVPNKSPNFI
jgi:hypothetical protein